MLALLDLYLKAPVCYYESNDSFKLSDVRCSQHQIFPRHLALCGCIELYDVNVKYQILSILYFEMIFYFIKSIRLSGQWSEWSGAWRCGGRPEIPTHHQSH